MPEFVWQLTRLMDKSEHLPPRALLAKLGDEMEAIRGRMIKASLDEHGYPNLNRNEKGSEEKDPWRP
jgi:hypothetical protein